MNDVLCSASSVHQAKEILAVVRSATEFVGFNLRGVLSNSREFLQSIPPHALSKEYVDLDISRDKLPEDRVLGVGWLVEEDSFTFSCGVPNERRIATKRTFLSALSAVFDPLGLVVPVMVPLRSLFQKVCTLRIGWDDRLPSDVESVWVEWLANMHQLADIKVKRCLVPIENACAVLDLHIFADGSEMAYAASAYTRYTSETGSIICTLLMAKARQVPISRGAYTTIPRIELAAAKLAITLASQVKRELSVPISSTTFWSDSFTVLNYIGNTNRRFQRFVANRVNFILQHSSAGDWRYVPGSLNVADIASRGCSIRKFIDNKEWFEGPAFLRHEISSFEEPFSSDEDLESKRVLHITQDRGFLIAGGLLTTTSSWATMTTRVAVFVAFGRFLRNLPLLKLPISGKLTRTVESVIWKYVQSRNYSDQIELLKGNKSLPKGDKLAPLSAFIKDDLLVIGSRIHDVHKSSEFAYPVILSSDDPVVQAYIRHVHAVNKHAGKALLIALLQERYHIIGLGRFIKRMLLCCKICVRLNGRPENPIMAPLPPARVNPAPRPFTHTGIDFFGPIVVSQGRRSVKAYGVLFTCLTCRAVHLEVSMSLDVSSFIAALIKTLPG